MNETEALLDVPCAHGGPVATARLKVEPEDFIVREWLGFEADNDGPHWLLTVRKRDANTQWVARELARIAGVHPRDVGYAGLKDRRAVSEQAFTVPVSATPEQWLDVRGEGYKVIAAARHRRKLKIGALRANAFELVLRDVQGERTALEKRLATIAREGVPNYFGPQRFGRDNNNLHTALAWFRGGEGPTDRQQRSFALSAARSALFNQLVAARVRANTWNRLLPGDVANLNGSGSIFDVDVVDDTLRHRCSELDIHPTAPLWGQGELRSKGEVAELERAVAAQFAELSHGLVSVGMEQERRATRMAVHDLQWQWQEQNLLLSFRLGRGAFATAVIREIVSTDAELPFDES